MSPKERNLEWLRRWRSEERLTPRRPEQEAGDDTPSTRDLHPDLAEYRGLSLDDWRHVVDDAHRWVIGDHHGVDDGRVSGDGCVTDCDIISRADNRRSDLDDIVKTGGRKEEEDDESQRKEKRAHG